MRIAEERFNAFKAMCSPSAKLYLTYSVSGGQSCSPYIAKLKNLIPCLKEIEIAKLDADEFAFSESSAYQTAARYGLYSREGVTIRKLLSENEVYSDKFDYIDNVRFGYAADHSIPDRSANEQLYGNKMRVSATSFEEYSKCPFRFFVSYGLKLSRPKKTQLNSLYWGNAVHACMERVFKKYAKAEFIKLTDKQLEDEIISAVNEFCETEFKGGFSKKADFDVFIGRLKANTLRVLKRIRTEMHGSQFVPELIEYNIGGENSALNVSADGHSLIFYGKVDRADVYKNYYVRVLDYKTGTKEFKIDQLYNGINLQMFLYLYELTREGGRLGGMKPAGVLYVPVISPDNADGRYVTQEEIQGQINKSLCMNGMLLNDADVLRAMEQIDAGTSGKYIPIKLKADSTIGANSNVTDEEGFEKIKQMAMDELVQMCSDLYSGRIPAAPLEIKGSSFTLCESCDYQDLCANFDYEKIKREWRDSYDMDKTAE